MNKNQVFKKKIAPMTKRSSLFYFIFVYLVLLSSSYLLLIKYLSKLSTKNRRISSKTVNQSESNQVKSNETLGFDRLFIDIRLVDIYRIDVSCGDNFVPADSILKTKYRNRFKKCSFSSTNPNLAYQMNVSVDYNVFLRGHIKYKPTLSLGGPGFLGTSQGYNLTRFGFLDKLSPQTGKYVPNFFIPSAVCNPKQIDNVVFIVPYTADRLSNLELLLLNLHTYLQNLPAWMSFSYRIIVVEQTNADTKGFNKGRLFNAAFKYIVQGQSNSESFNSNVKEIRDSARETFDCVILHDVDIIPAKGGKLLGENGDYRCRQMPWHMTRKIKKLSLEQTIIYPQFLTGKIMIHVFTILYIG